MKNLLMCLAYFFTLSLQAQDYYYNGNERVKIYRSSESFISFEPKNQSLANAFEKTEVFPLKGFTILERRRLFMSANIFKDQKAQITPALMLEKKSNFKIYPTKTIRVKLKQNVDKAQILKLIPQGYIVYIEQKYDVFKLNVQNIHRTLEIANKIYESGLVEFSLPDFYIPIQLNQINDPLFPLQFQMHNTGQVIDGVAGVSDIDCNALEAWDFSLGNNITVAIIDQGLEAHEDIGNRLIGGFTPATNGNGTPEANNATHGMNCAGVIGASHNNSGIRGVAPGVNFLSVNIFAGGTTAGDIADGIMWAIENGADVLSNSWGYNSCSFSSADIDNALENAVNNGRNGNGSIVVFASGNSGGCVTYPAKSNDVLSVGAIDNRGTLFRYSSRGPELDLVAPSGETNYLGNIRTIDRMGNAGRVAGNYEFNFGGTSAACPVVAGVAALTLWVNTNLTQQEVRDILVGTATDMGANGFDNNFGFGRVNALAAVERTIETLPHKIEGPNEVCSGDRPTYTLTDVPSGAKINWNFSYILSGQGTSKVQIGIFYGSAVRQLTAEVTYQGETHTIRKQIRSESIPRPKRIPKIRKAKNNMDFLVCCSSWSGTGYTVDHAECYDNCDDLEWTYYVYHSDPRDSYYFSKRGRIYDNTGVIGVKKFTFSPLIVDAKARNVNRGEICNDEYSGYSNGFARYYGVVKKGAYRSMSFYNRPLSRYVPLAYYVDTRERELKIQSVHIWDWLNELFLEKDLSQKEINSIKQWLAVADQKRNATIEIRHMNGRILKRQLLSEKTTVLRLHELSRGTYLLRFNINNIIHHEVIVL